MSPPQIPGKASDWLLWWVAYGRVILLLSWGACAGWQCLLRWRCNLWVGRALGPRAPNSHCGVEFGWWGLDRAWYLGLRTGAMATLSFSCVLLERRGFRLTVYKLNGHYRL